ncbi:hypothetical protein Lalb_Chr07g0188011 [Lupinus albus]|uniref:Uncharacterized protein n=1 Tax=Lupinus albus TaxID=3870 RepID=A0A6A4Q9N9_LUPAL|nr:hypothetical protein Lalb_Chr07g0188011 [Lupinus albus]
MITILMNMAAPTSSPRLIPKRGKVLKRVLKMVFSCAFCSASQVNPYHHPKTTTKTSASHL